MRSWLGVPGTLRENAVNYERAQVQQLTETATRPDAMSPLSAPAPHFCKECGVARLGSSVSDSWMDAAVRPDRRLARQQQRAAVPVKLDGWRRSLRVALPQVPDCHHWVGFDAGPLPALGPRTSC